MQQLKMKVSDQLLTEIPRFFGSFSSALREMFQNAWRAGAKTVTVAYDETAHTLIFTDDGPGCAAGNLLTAGESQWDNPEIVDPAGIGAFSLLRPEYVKGVTYRSGGAFNWSMKLTPDHLKGLPVDIIELPETTPGMKITIEMQEAVKITQESISSAICYYPLDVFWVDAAGEKVKVEPAKSWPASFSVTLPGIGTVEVDRRSSVHFLETTTVWQYIPIGSSATRDALKQAADRHQASKLIHAILYESDVRFFVDLSSGIRAKLPDRNELIHDENLDKAADEIVAALFLEFETTLVAAASELPDEMYKYNEKLLNIPDSHGWIQKLIWRSDVLVETLEYLGYQKVEYSDPEQYEGTTMDDGDGPYLVVEIEHVSKFVRNHPILPVSSDILKTAMNKQGVYATLDPATITHVQINGLRFSEKSNYLAFAERIIVAGRELKWLIFADGLLDQWEIPDIDDCPDKPDELVIVTSLTPEEFIKHAGDPLWVGAVAYSCDQMGTLWDNDFAEERWGEDFINTDEIQAALEAEAMSYLSNELAGAREDQQILKNTLENEMEKARRLLLSASSEVSRTKAPLADYINQKIQEALLDIESAESALGTEIAAFETQFESLRQ